VPRCRLNIYGRRAFPVASPTVWNSLPDELRDPACDVDSFNSSLKQSCSALTSVTSALEVINVMRSINPRFTYLLYLLIRLSRFLQRTCAVCRGDATMVSPVETAALLASPTDDELAAATASIADLNDILDSLPAFTGQSDPLQWRAVLAWCWG